MLQPPPGTRDCSLCIGAGAPRPIPTRLLARFRGGLAAALCALAAQLTAPAGLDAQATSQQSIDYTVTLVAPPPSTFTFAKEQDFEVTLPRGTVYNQPALPLTGTPAMFSLASPSHISFTLTFSLPSQAVHTGDATKTLPLSNWKAVIYDPVNGYVDYNITNGGAISHTHEGDHVWQLRVVPKIVVPNSVAAAPNGTYTATLSVTLAIIT